MPVTPLILSLLGGYLFCILEHHTAAVIRNLQGRRIFLMSSIAGAILLFSATITVKIVAATYLPIASWFNTIFPYEHLGKSMLSFIYGPFWGVLTSALLRTKTLAPVNKYIWKVFDNTYRSGLEQKIITSSEGEGELNEMLYTLSNGKVYTGFCVGLAEGPRTKYSRNESEPWVELIPVASGYRDEEKNLVFTHDYKEEIRKDGKDVRTHFPISEVIVINNFDWDLYRNNEE